MKEKDIINKDTNKKISLIILTIAVVAIIIAGSYAAFKFSKTGIGTNVITLGNLELTLTEGTAISLEDTYPLTDSEGLALDGYSFTLKNTGTAPVNFKIYLDNIEITSPDVKLDDKYLKYNLTKNEVSGNIAYLTSLGTDKNRVLDSGTLAPEASNSYNIKIWPTVDIDGDFGGQVWKAKLRITGDQIK